MTLESVLVRQNHGQTNGGRKDARVLRSVSFLDYILYFKTESLTERYKEVSNLSQLFEMYTSVSVVENSFSTSTFSFSLASMVIQPVRLNDIGYKIRFLLT